MGVVSIPKAWMGRTMQEQTVKAVLRSLNQDLHFDLGACHNIWHPYMDSRQNVFYLGRSIGAMDRVTLPEVPIWTTKRGMVQVHWSEVKPGEIAMFRTEGVIATCRKCSHRWGLPLRPVGAIACPAFCENVGASTDATLFGWEDRPSQTAHVFRTVRDRVVLVGWRHTFFKLCCSDVPGVTKETLESAFGVNLDPRVIDDVQIDEDIESKMLDRMVEVA